MAEGRINPRREGRVLEAIRNGDGQGTEQGILAFLAAQPGGPLRKPTVHYFLLRGAEAGIVEEMTIGKDKLYLPVLPGGTTKFGTSTDAFAGTKIGLAFRQRVLERAESRSSELAVARHSAPKPDKKQDLADVSPSDPWEPGSRIDWLDKLAVAVHSQLRTRKLRAFTPGPKPVAAPSSDSDGWFAWLGEVGVRGIEGVCLFFDTAAGYDHRRLWAGVLVRQRGRAEQLAQVAAKRVGKSLRLEPDDFQVRDGFSVMKRPLPRRAFDRPVLELYDSGAMTLGFYLSGTPRTFSTPPRKLILRTTRLLAELIRSFEEESTALARREAREAARPREAGATRRTIRRVSYPPDSLAESDTHVLPAESKLLRSSEEAANQAGLQAAEAERARARGQGVGPLSAQARSAIERHAMNSAADHYRRLGYKVEDISARAPCDLVCRKGGKTLRVEVKGTQANGLEVLLTPGEVAHARAHRPHTVLFIVHSIVLEGPPDAPVATGGNVRVIEPWDIDTGKLKPMGYLYSLPL